MKTHEIKQYNIKREPQIRADLQWLGKTVRETKFGFIRGITVRNGVIAKGPRFSVTRTGKPGIRCNGLATVTVLNEALQDLGHDIALSSTCNLEVKVARGSILSWDLEEPEPSQIHQI